VAQIRSVAVDVRRATGLAAEEARTLVRQAAVL